MVYVRLFSIFHEHIHKYFSLYIIIIICRFIVSELKMILLISPSHLTEYAMILYLLSCRVDLLFIHFILFKKIFFFLLFNNENSTGYCYWCGAMCCCCYCWYHFVDVCCCWCCCCCWGYGSALLLLYEFDHRSFYYYYYFIFYIKQVWT